MTLRTILLSKTWRDTISHSASIRHCYVQSVSDITSRHCQQSFLNVSQEEKWCTSFGQKHEEKPHRICQKRPRTIWEWKHETSWAHLAWSTWWDHILAVGGNTRRHHEHTIAYVSSKITHNLCEKSQEQTSAHISWPSCIFPTRWRTIWG